MTYLIKTKPADLRVGDIISVYGYGVLRDRMTVTDKTQHVISADHIPNDVVDLSTTDSEWKFYLIERPKPQLPEYKGARIVAWKIEGKEYPEGIVLQHDGTLASPWEGYYVCCRPDEIEEWAELPADHFDSLRNN